MRRVFLAAALFFLIHSNILASETTYTIITSDKIKSSTRQLEEGIKVTLGDARPNEIDYRRPEAKVWIEKLGIEFLPYVIFSKDIQNSERFFDLARAGMIERKGAEYVIPDGMILPVGVMFFKRKASGGGTLDLFITSQDIQGKEAVNIVAGFLKDNPGAFKFKCHYLATFDDFGVESVNGKNEVREDVYQLLIQKYYPDKFFRYHELFREGKGFDVACKEAGINAEKIKAKIKEGIELLRQDAELAKEHGVKSSPTFVWEGRIFFLNLFSFQRFLAAEYPLAKTSSSCPSCTQSSPSS